MLCVSVVNKIITVITFASTATFIQKINLIIFIKYLTSSITSISSINI